jgi:acyl carrier protein
MPDRAIIDRIKDLIPEALEQTTGGELEGPVTDDMFIPDVLDSIGVAMLIELCEDEWDVRFADEELGPELFENVVALAEAIEVKRRAT